MKLAVGCLGVLWLGIKWVFLLGYKAIVIVIRAFTTSGTVKDAEQEAEADFHQRPAFDVAIPIGGDAQADDVPTKSMDDTGDAVESLDDYAAPDAILKRHVDDHPDYSLPDALEDREDEDGDRV